MASEPSPVVGTTSTVKPSELNTFHRNARRGDVGAIASSLEINGQFKPIVANIGTHTGRPHEVLAGNHTLTAFRDLAERNPFDERWARIAVHWVDVDEDMATRIVLVDNRSFEQGAFDDSALIELMQQVGTTGTGYTDDDLDELMSKVDFDDEPTDAKPPPSADPVISYTIVFDDTDQQDVWFAFIKALQREYPELTLAERLVTHLGATESERVA